MILVGFWIKTLKKPSMIHWNLKVACLAECYCIFVVCFTRFIIEIDEIFNGKFLPGRLRFLIKIVHDTTSYQYFMIHACFAIERSLATFFVNIYENIGKQKCWITFMFIMGLASIPCQILPRYIFKGYFFALIYFTVFIEIFVGIFFRPCGKSQKILPYLEQQPIVIRSVTGKVITQNSDQDEHFRELKRLWDSI
uniref:Uncharacterized protein n=1 Tax=Panagrolaimus sp. PS1159 TaxID=55785 RepID=A0AC35FS01_9BILA